MIAISATDLNTKSNYQDFQRFPDLDLSMAAGSEATLPALTEACKRLRTGDRKRHFEDRASKLGEAQQQARERLRTEASYAWGCQPHQHGSHGDGNLGANQGQGLVARIE